jgi:hypothetical protein
VCCAIITPYASKGDGGIVAGGAMDLLIEAIKAVGLIIGTVGIIIVAPLIFMVIFSLVSGFREDAPGEE